MKNHSDEEPDWKKQREKIIGLGESSIRKSYYPELQQQHDELIKKNEELHAAYEELTANEEELQQKYDELSRKEQELERKNVELKESEEKYRSLVEESSDGIIIINERGDVIEWNQALTHITGIPRENALNRSFIDRMIEMIPPENLDLTWKEMIKAEIEQSIRTGSSNLFQKAMELEICRVGGQRRIIQQIIFPIRTFEGTRIGSIIRDITEQRKAKEALRQSEEQLSLAIEGSGVGLWDWRVQTGETIFNERWAEIAGYSLRELAPVSVKTWEQLCHPDDTRHSNELLKKHLAGITPFYECETRMHHKDGSWVWVLDRGKVVERDCQGNPVRMTGTLLDITERKRVEEERRTAREYTEKLITTANAMIVGLDSRGNITVFNKAAEDITGYSSADLAGRNWFEVIVPRERYPRVWEEFTRLLVKGLPVDFENPILTKSGEERYIAWKNAEIHEGEEITGTISFGIDITERKRIEMALQLARHKLTLLNAVTFKDIQTAVFSLTAYLELMKTVVEDEKGRSYLEKQVSANQKILDSLNFAKNYQDMGIQNPRWQDVNQVFLFAISHLDFLHIRHTCRVEGLQIYTDPLLEKVLFHLMQNVLTHGVHATEVTMWYKEKQDGLILIIEDNGVGIPAEEKHMIFDRGHGKSTGLGLFLVREVLSITGITIKETGEPGKGARFELAVPTGNYRFNKNVKIKKKGKG